MTDLIRWIDKRQLDGNRKHVEAIHRHPGSCICLLESDAMLERCAAVEHADVIQAKEAAFKQVVALQVLAVHPPSEVQHQLVKRLLQKCVIRNSCNSASNLQSIVVHSYFRTSLDVDSTAHQHSPEILASTTMRGPVDSRR